MELEGIINEHFNELNENEKAIIEYIIKNKANCQEMTIIELAKETLTSKSSILRLTQKLGFSGYSEFKYSIRKDISKKNVTGEKQDLYSLQIKDIEATKKIFEPKMIIEEKIQPRPVNTVSNKEVEKEDELEIPAFIRRKMEK